MIEGIIILVGLAVTGFFMVGCALGAYKTPEQRRREFTDIEKDELEEWEDENND